MRWMLVLRRARRDAVLLAVVAVLVAASVALATALPRLVTSAVDQGARAAIASAGAEADVVVRTIVGHSAGGSEPAGSFEQLQALAEELPGRLPAAYQGLTAAPSFTIASSDATGVIDDGAVTPNRLAVQFATVGDEAQHRLDLAAGRLPAVADTGIEIAISRQAADVAGLDLGANVALPKPGGGAVTATVVGIVTSTDEQSRTWRDLRRMWAPTGNSRQVPGSSASIVALVSPESLERVQTLFLDTFAATVRVPLDPASFTAQDVALVADAARGLDLHRDELAGDFPAQVSALSDFEQALADFPARARAAVAQSSLVIAGVLGVAVVVLAQLGRLLVMRRSADLALERARGAALPAIALGGLLESLPMVLLASVIGILLSRATTVEPASLVVVLVAAAAPPIQAVAVARGAWWSRRVAANAVDRRAAEQALRTRRISGEVALALLAVAAVAAIRTRGLLQGATAGIDPLLAAAPLLFAAVVAVVLLRLYPLVIHIVASAARKTTGALGVLGAAQAQRALSPLPVLALTLATALAIGGGLLIQTVASGQRDASWSSVGADARISSAVTDDEVQKIGRMPGVTAAGSFLAVPSIGLTGGPSTSFVTLVAIDPGFADVVEGLAYTPSAADPGDVVRLRSLAASADSDRLPVLVDPVLADRLADVHELVVTIGGSNVEVDVVGTTTAGPGYLRGSLVYADRSALASRLGKPLVADTTLVLGPGAAGAAASLPGATVLTRAQWIKDQQDEPLVAGVNRVMSVSTASVALLAAISLVASVLSGSRSRARSLALLRTLGMRVRFGWWLAAAETAPIVVAALLGGILAGFGMMLLLGPSLGLATLAGSSSEPRPSFDLSVGIGVALAAIAVLLVAVAAEVLTHRRARLSEVLRVGETT